MNLERRTTILLALFLSISGSASALGAATPSGLWDAVVVSAGTEIPFRFEIQVTGREASGAFFNGDERIQSTSGTFEGGKLSLRFEHYASRLEAVLSNGRLEGTYSRAAFPTLPFSARPFTPAPPPAAEIPSIAGSWIIPVKNPAGEVAWRMVVRQSGAEVAAAILRIDGDTGQLSGTWRNGKYVLSHFSGARPSVVEITVSADGTLDLLQNGKTRLRAVRSTEARSRGVAEPADPSRWTSVQDPTQPFHFSAPDLNGRLVRDTDPLFHGKVVIVTLGGSWCPNCHDEAPLLVELYRKYRDRGLEVVNLSFEETDQLKDPARLRAFIRQYDIPYTVLLAGETDSVHEVLPQAVNLNTWPATFILGRDGRVRSTHAGFAGKATGPLHEELVEEMTATITRLLAEEQKDGR